MLENARWRRASALQRDIAFSLPLSQYTACKLWQNQIGAASPWAEAGE
jgi:hypothetical protein